MTSPDFSRFRTVRRSRPTLLLRCLLLLAACLLANALLWTISAIVFTRQAKRDSQHRDASHLLSLCLLAWTLGLRHGLDADHISIIDNATRRIASLQRDPQRPHLGLRRPVTCGLFFSLGHSTIVVSVLIAVAISTSVVNHLGGVSEVGGIIGASVSGSFLFLFGVINSILLWRSWRGARGRSTASPGSEKAGIEDAGPATPTTDSKLETTAHKDQAKELGEKAYNEAEASANKERHNFRGIFTRIARPLLRMVDRPYKLYPIGILFGFGFDTASSIALLGVAAATNTAIVPSGGEPIESAGQEGRGTSDGSIVLLALLFTAGMTLVDGCDSILMINAYAPGELRSGAGRRRWALFEKDEAVPTESLPGAQERIEPDDLVDDLPQVGPSSPTTAAAAATDISAVSTATTLSHMLTLASIVLAFVISAIQILGLIGENCERPRRVPGSWKDDGGSSGGTATTRAV
ncbi:uncharacterized protein PFL1_00472 [Pseudozyma flocculosa PF-1]|uniref:uncharacterized protein n=1 Tax=Pseudozyma flocculosa PF-1 TaxID=1277687 RepID=UPI00045610BF|nr:uncharacterized protein PFL1_00472 [Pseudozyma flocculosa PF-1]EPQ32275.1 hypothetical protein PFL1_00472 [Pseudozyma flocculosa PF-1]